MAKIGAMSRKEAWAERARKVAEARTDDFVQLLRRAELDPKKHLRFADWSGVSFAGCDLRGFDFTGARLHDCDFTGALIDGARFDGAEINGASLRAAKDWESYVRNWRPSGEAIADGHLPVGAVFQDAPFAPEMVAVPAGAFMMGSPEDEEKRSLKEGPRHKVVISRPFAVGRFPVTFDEWDFAAGGGACRRRKPSDYGWGRGRRPVIDVSWKDAQNYIEWLNKKVGKAYRLLSEAEWEYACRAGTTTPFSFGGTISTEQANYDGNYVYGSGRKGAYREQTLPVGSFSANAFGLHDMHGNVSEWCADVWHDSYEGAPADGSAWMHGGDLKAHVVRGGSWVDYPRDLRSASRFRTDSGGRVYVMGFRVARAFYPLHL
jgi:formylglycine-generating enzyme required for sulfatase activity